MLCSLSQWARRSTAIPKDHEAVAWCSWQLWHSRPLRPPASLLHNAALPSVPASRCAKAALRAGHRFAPFGLRQQALCKVAFAGVGRTAFGSSRSLARPTRRRLRALVVVVAPWHQSGAVRCVVGQWPAASNCVCAPAHPCASPLRGISPARWSVRPPPWGLPQPARLCYWILLQVW